MFEKQLVETEWSTSLHSNLQLHELYDSVSGDVDYFAHIKFHELRKTHRKLVLRLCAVAAAVLFCCLPFQVSYTLSPFGITNFTHVHQKVFDVISFLNSSQNPLMYWYYHEEHKRLSKLF